jgi:hypothetical protein
MGDVVRPLIKYAGGKHRLGCRIYRTSGGHDIIHQSYVAARERRHAVK